MIINEIGAIVQEKHIDELFYVPIIRHHKFEYFLDIFVRIYSSSTFCDEFTKFLNFFKIKNRLFLSFKNIIQLPLFFLNIKSLILKMTSCGIFLYRTEDFITFFEQTPIVYLTHFKITTKKKFEYIIKFK